MPDQLSPTFDEFYLATRVSVLRQLTAMTMDREVAADVVQEAYARAWQRWSRVSTLEDPRGWVRTVAWRLAVSHYRRNAVAHRLRHLVSPPESVDTARRSEDRLDLEEALRRLPAESRRVLVLKEYGGLTVEEIAAETGVAEGTVKSRLSRARARLGESLGAGYRHPEDSAQEVTP